MRVAVELEQGSGIEQRKRETTAQIRSPQVPSKPKFSVKPSNIQILPWVNQEGNSEHIRLLNCNENKVLVQVY